jgi:hypothetical protein
MKQVMQWDTLQMNTLDSNKRIGIPESSSATDSTVFSRRNDRDKTLRGGSEDSSYNSSSAASPRFNPLNREMSIGANRPPSTASATSLPSKIRNFLEDFGSSQQHSGDWTSASPQTHLSQLAPTAKDSIDPPRKAKDGYEWVWFPAGYWAERNISDTVVKGKPISQRKWRSSSHSHESKRGNDSSRYEKTLSSHIDTSRNKPLPTTSKASTIVSKDSDLHHDRESGMSQRTHRGSKILRGFNYMSPTYPHFVSPEGTPEGLYCKTKRTLEIGRNNRQREVCCIFLTAEQPTVINHIAEQ